MKKWMILQTSPGVTRMLQESIVVLEYSCSWTGKERLQMKRILTLRSESLLFTLNVMQYIFSITIRSDLATQYPSKNVDFICYASYWFWNLWLSSCFVKDFCPFENICKSVLISNFGIKMKVSASTLVSSQALQRVWLAGFTSSRSPAEISGHHLFKNKNQSIPAQYWNAVEYCHDLCPIFGTSHKKSTDNSDEYFLLSDTLVH